MWNVCEIEGNYLLKKGDGVCDNGCAMKNTYTEKLVSAGFLNDCGGGMYVMAGHEPMAIEFHVNGGSYDVVGCGTGWGRFTTRYEFEALAWLVRATYESTEEYAIDQLNKALAE